MAMNGLLVPVPEPVTPVILMDAMVLFEIVVEAPVDIPLKWIPQKRALLPVPVSV